MYPRKKDLRKPPMHLYVPGVRDLLCQRPSRDEVTPAERRIDHREKMAAKVKRRDRAYAAFVAGRSTILHPRPAANVGRRHPDYGMSPAEHFAAKEARA